MAITAQYLQQQITLLDFVVHLAVADSVVAPVRVVQQVQQLVVLRAVAVDSAEFESQEKFLKFLEQLSQ
jgi:hypothetical protein